MKFDLPLKTGTFIKRHKRFMVDVQLDSGEVITAHCPNTGAMTGLLNVGEKVYLLESKAEGRKYPYTWEMAEVDNTLVGVNTQNPPRLIREAFAKKSIPLFKEYETLSAEIRCKDSRLDFRLDHPNKPSCYLEVKNVHLKRGETVFFPDSVTERGQRHLHALADLVKEGSRCFLVYIIQRDDCKNFRVAGDIDPNYAKAFEEAKGNGVEFLAYTCRLSPSEIELTHSIPIFNPFYG